MFGLHPDDAVNQPRPPIRHGDPWLRQEVDILFKGWASGLNRQALARKHQRTVGAVTERLMYTLEDRGLLRFHYRGRPGEAWRLQSPHGNLRRLHY